MGAYEEPKETCGTICLKYLLFAFNFMFWVSLRAVGFRCFSSGCRAATCFLRAFLNAYDSTSESAETWGRRLRGQAVMTAWSVSKHRWWRKKMRRNHLIFKQSKVGIIGWSLLLFWLVELQQSYTAMHSKSKSSELSSNEDTVFWERTTTNNCHIWMRRIKLFQARHWFRVCNCTLPICDNHLSARQSDVSHWQTRLGLCSAGYWRHHHVDVLLLKGLCFSTRCNAVIRLMFIEL